MALKNYSIVVNDYSGTNREGAVQALIDICGYIRSDAEEIIDDLPQEIVVELDGATAEKIAQALDAEGLDAEIYNEDQYPVEYETKRNEGSGFWKVLGVALLAGLFTRRHRRPPYYTRTVFGGWRRPRRKIVVKPAPRRVRGFGNRMVPRNTQHNNGINQNHNNNHFDRNDSHSAFDMNPHHSNNRPSNGSTHNRPQSSHNRPQSSASRPSKVGGGHGGRGPGH